MQAPPEQELCRKKKTNTKKVRKRTCTVCKVITRCDKSSNRVLTSPGLPHSGQRCSSQAPPWTSASAGSTNRPQSGWREELHHRMANPEEGWEKKEEIMSLAQFLGNQNKRWLKRLQEKRYVVVGGRDTCGVFLSFVSEPSFGACSTSDKTSQIFLIPH